MTIKGADFTGAPLKLDQKAVAAVSQNDSEITLQMPRHESGYAVLAVGTAHAPFLYVPPRLDELPAGYITTIAGIGAYGGEYGPAKLASMALPWGIALDRAGQVYFTDTENDRVFRIANGMLEPFAGTGLPDGPRPRGKTPATEVAISFPRTIAFDSHDDLIVPDDRNYLWRVDPSGLAEIIAGTGQRARIAPDGVPANATAIGEPTHVAVDADDNIYFIDFTNARIRRIDAAGTISTVAGNGTFGFSGDGGPAIDAQFNLAYNDEGGLAADRAGNLFLIDKANRRVRRIAKATGIIDTVVGPAVNGQGLDNIQAIAIGPDDALYFSNAAGIYRRAADGAITQITTGRRGFSEDGSTLPSAAIGLVLGIAVDAAGNLLYAEADTQRIRAIDRTTNRLSTLAGIGPQTFGEEGPAIAASLHTINLDIDLLPTAELVISGRGRLYKISRDGRLTRFAGGGDGSTPLSDTPASGATMTPNSVSVSHDGTIDISEENLGVYRIDPDGIVRHSAGLLNQCAFAGDGGPALTAGLCQTWDAVRDDAGNLFIADSNNNRIRRVDAKSGVITTFAGSGPPNGFERYGAGSTCGDGGPAKEACINTPYGIAFDRSGNVLVCEGAPPGFGRIRKIDAGGMITTMANVSCTKLTWAFGNVFTVITPDLVARISPAGDVTPLTAASSGFSGDGGLARDAHILGIYQSEGITTDAEGNLFFADSGNLRIRAIRYGAVLAPPNATITASASGTTIAATVHDSTGNTVPGVRVDFTAPAIGPSCHFQNGTNTIGVVTDVNGLATTSCTPNCLGSGSFTVTAQPLTATAIASVTMSDHSGPCRRRAARH